MPRNPCGSPEHLKYSRICLVVLQTLASCFYTLKFPLVFGIVRITISELRATSLATHCLFRYHVGTELHASIAHLFCDASVLMILKRFYVDFRGSAPHILHYQSVAASHRMLWKERLERLPGKVIMVRNVVFSMVLRSRRSKW